MSTMSGDGKANEFTFQNDMIRQLVSNGWVEGKPEKYNRELALYSEDVLGFVKDTQNQQWKKTLKLTKLLNQTFGQQRELSPSRLRSKGLLTKAN